MGALDCKASVDGPASKAEQALGRTGTQVAPAPLDHSSPNDKYGRCSIHNSTNTSPNQTCERDRASIDASLHCLPGDLARPRIAGRALVIRLYQKPRKREYRKPWAPNASPKPNAKIVNPKPKKQTWNLKPNYPHQNQTYINLNSKFGIQFFSSSPSIERARNESNHKHAPSDPLGVEQTQWRRLWERFEVRECRWSVVRQHPSGA